jgi:steroid 5-alpha reductase family enzyme
MNDLIILGAVAAIVALDFIGGWWFGSKINNYSLVDAMWAFWIGLAGVIYAALGTGDFEKRIASGSIAAIWGFRLAYHLQKRIRFHHPEEDSRYRKLREVWRGRVSSAFFWFFQAQALSVLILTIPYFLIARDSSPWGGVETAGLTIALIGFLEKPSQTTKCPNLNHRIIDHHQSAAMGFGDILATQITFLKW